MAGNGASINQLARHLPFLARGHLFSLAKKFHRAPLGYFYNTPHRVTLSSPPLISETTGPILKKKIKRNLKALEKLSI